MIYYIYILLLYPIFIILLGAPHLLSKVGMEKFESRRMKIPKIKNLGFRLSLAFYFCYLAAVLSFFIFVIIYLKSFDLFLNSNPVISAVCCIICAFLGYKVFRKTEYDNMVEIGTLDLRNEKMSETDLKTMTNLFSIFFLFMKRFSALYLVIYFLFKTI